jgi:hypothetical protein
MTPLMLGSATIPAGQYTPLPIIDGDQTCPASPAAQAKQL